MEYNLSEIKAQVSERMGKTDATFLGKIEDVRLRSQEPGEMLVIERACLTICRFAS